MFEVDRNKCIKCGACSSDCIVKIIKRDTEDFPYVPAELDKFCINCQHCLAICPTGAITCNGVTAAQCPPIGNVPSPENMLNLLRQRRSIRRYKQENLPPEVIAKLRESLAWSATGCNDDSLLFRIIDNKEDMTFFRETATKILCRLIKSKILQILYPNAKRFLFEILNGEDVIFRNAPHMIVCAVRKNAPCKEADPWIALANFDLYAQTFGVGTCWCGFAYYLFKFSRTLRKRLDFPKNYKITSIILFGKPAVKYQRSTFFTVKDR